MIGTLTLKGIKFVDYTKYSLQELRDAIHEIPAELQRREREEKNALKEELSRIAKERGFNLSDFIEHKPVNTLSLVEKKHRQPAKDKYFSPTDPTVAWSGRGRKPRWVEQFIKDGGELKDLEKA